MNRAKKVPSSRFSRLTALGGFAAKVAGNAFVDGAKQLSKGKSPSLKDLVLQPKNVEHLADKLAQLRGAAMKVGQMLSMDAGDLLPPELSILLDKLVLNAQHMPHKQLLSVLESAWGEQWLDNFSHFELTPFASASIGQVHLAYSEKGEKLAVKVQYPGVAKAINSDVDNVATLLNLSGLLPKHLDIAPLLEEAKLQLLVEADYKAEASFVNGYQQHLADDSFILPTVDEKLSTEHILVMNFVEGVPVETIEGEPQAIRDDVVTRLMGLFFRELFSFKLMQTDPNFANYQYQTDSKKVVLLDFGATRDIPTKISLGYQKLISAGVRQDQKAMVAAARSIGFFAEDICPNYLQQILDIFALACEPLLHDGAYDFGTSGLAQRVKQQGMAINRQQDQWHTPPVDAIFIHRKLAGLYLLAAKLKAKVNVQRLFTPYITQ